MLLFGAHKAYGYLQEGSQRLLQHLTGLHCHGLAAILLECELVYEGHETPASRAPARPLTRVAREHIRLWSNDVFCYEVILEFLQATCAADVPRPC